MSNRAVVPLAAALFLGCSGLLDTDELADRLFSASFDLRVSPAHLTVTSGATSAPLTVTLVPMGSFSETVEVEIRDLPGGAVPSPAAPFRLRPNRSREVVIAATGVAPGDYWPQFRADDDGWPVYRTIRLTVVEPPGSSTAAR